MSGFRGFEWGGVKGGVGSAEGVYHGGVAIYLGSGNMSVKVREKVVRTRMWERCS